MVKEHNLGQVTHTSGNDDETTQGKEDVQMRRTRNLHHPRNHHQPPSTLQATKWHRPLWGTVAVAVLLLALTSACRLAPDPETMSRQARAFPWPFGPSVSDGVYSPTIVEDVYSTE
ncbi:MAG: hypothetical protein KZY74_17670 [Paenibacillaceae bacterium]|nr:hypothetical protein [Paenibacillaceae bacterium]